jgi:hypothetical protein
LIGYLEDQSPNQLENDDYLRILRTPLTCRLFVPIMFRINCNQKGSQMTQLSLIPALEAARFRSADLAPIPRGDGQVGAAMELPNRPTAAQVSYLKRLTGIRTDVQLARYVSRKIAGDHHNETKSTLTKRDFAKAIDLEVAEKRWAN